MSIFLIFFQYSYKVYSYKKSALLPYSYLIFARSHFIRNILLYLFDKIYLAVKCQKLDFRTHPCLHVTVLSCINFRFSGSILGDFISATNFVIVEIDLTS